MRAGKWDLQLNFRFGPWCIVFCPPDRWWWGAFYREKKKHDRITSNILGMSSCNNASSGPVSSAQLCTHYLRRHRLTQKSVHTLSNSVVLFTTRRDREIITKPDQNETRNGRPVFYVVCRIIVTVVVVVIHFCSMHFAAMQWGRRRHQMPQWLKCCSFIVCFPLRQQRVRSVVCHSTMWLTHCVVSFFLSPLHECRPHHTSVQMRKMKIVNPKETPIHSNIHIYLVSNRRAVIHLW